MPNTDIKQYFEKISNLGFDNEKKYITPVEINYRKRTDGLIKFKNELQFSRFRNMVIKSIEDIAIIFYQLGIVDDINEGINVIPKFYGQELCYTEKLFIFKLDKSIYFRQMHDPRKNEFLVIQDKIDDVRLR